MFLEMFVNELSLVPPAVDWQTGQVRAAQFVMSMIAATSRGVQRSLRLPTDFFTMPISAGYDWYAWLSDKRVEREIQQYFRSLASKTPYLVDEPDIEAVWAGIDCYWQRAQAMGLKAAYVADGLAMSLSTREDWNTESITCEIQEIVDDDVSCRSESIHHSSTVEHVHAQTGWINQRNRGSVKSGIELWDRTADFFPSLILCDSVENQMAGLPAESLASICRGLFELNTYCLQWQDGAFEPTQLGCNVSPESQVTLQKYGPERTFLCPDGNYRIFTWHAKVGKWRIYFDPSVGPGGLLVGYVGGHLNTVKFN